MMNFEQKLENYAELVIKKGVNVQKGQPVMIACPIESYELGYLMAKKAYDCGASDVVFNWYDDALGLLRYEKAPLESFQEFPEWIKIRQEYYFKKNGAVISITSSDPTLLESVDPEKIQASNIAQSKVMKPIMKYTMNDMNAWCVVGAASKGWAKCVFPDLEPEEAVEKLWDAIFYTTRCDQEDPIGAWDEHVATMDRHARFLNEKQFKYLHYKNSLGTDLTIELPKNHKFLSAGSTSDIGAEFIANMPTEEVFTLPKKDGVNGVVYSSKPLNYGGNLIDGMRFVFRDGKVVEYSAEKGQQYLDQMFSVDENGKYLGEVALVPYDSPISNLDIVFMNTLFDENASCHLAFGKAYPTCLEGGTRLTDEELEEKGVNDSLIHEDFMIGTEDLSIIGELENGEKLELFKDGNFAI
ncbi:MAG: aminopeptidase [Tissierellia bacterium]|nr:aminopeptidase [Tissierellia bacterium]